MGVLIWSPILRKNIGKLPSGKYKEGSNFLEGSTNIFGKALIIICHSIYLIIEIRQIIY